MQAHHLACWESTEDIFGAPAPVVLAIGTGVNSMAEDRCEGPLMFLVAPFQLRLFRDSVILLPPRAVRSWSTAMEHRSCPWRNPGLYHPLPYWATLGLWQRQSNTARAVPLAGTFPTALTTEQTCHIHVGHLNFALLILIS